MDLVEELLDPDRDRRRKSDGKVRVCIYHVPTELLTESTSFLYHAGFTF